MVENVITYTVAEMVRQAPMLREAVFFAVQGEPSASWHLSHLADSFPRYALQSSAEKERKRAGGRLVCSTGAATPLPGDSLLMFDQPKPPDLEMWRATHVERFASALALGAPNDDRCFIAFALLVLGTPHGERRAYFLRESYAGAIVIRAAAGHFSHGALLWNAGNELVYTPRTTIPFFVTRVTRDEDRYVPFSFGDLHGLLAMFGGLAWSE